MLGPNKGDSMRVVLTALILLVLATPAYSQTYIHPTIPGTTLRDFSAPSLMTDPTNPNVIHQTRPGTTLRDFSVPSYVITPSQPPVYHPPINPYLFTPRR